MCIKILIPEDFLFYIAYNRTISLVIVRFSEIKMRIKQITQKSDLSAKKVNFIAPLLNKRYTDPQLSFCFKLYHESVAFRKAILRSEMP